MVFFIFSINKPPLVLHSIKHPACQVLGSEWYFHFTITCQSSKFNHQLLYHCFLVFSCSSYSNINLVIRLLHSLRFLKQNWCDHYFCMNILQFKPKKNIKFLVCVRERERDLLENMRSHEQFRFTSPYMCLPYLWNIWIKVTFNEPGWSVYAIYKFNFT